MKRLSTVIAEAVLKPSRAHNLAYFMFGLVVASSVISMEQVESLSDFVLLISIVGGFISALLYFIKPVEQLLYVFSVANITIRYKRLDVGYRRLFKSPFIAEIKGKIIGGAYIFFTCVFLSYFNPLISLVVDGNLLLIRLFLLFVGFIILIVSLYDLYRLGEKIVMLDYYYANASIGKRTRSMHEVERALLRGDWTEASLIPDVQAKLSRTRKKV